MDSISRFSRSAAGLSRVAILMLTTTAAGWAQFIPAPAPPVGARQFPIMAWGSSPSDAVQLRWMKEAGLNISGFCRVEDLNLVAQAGLNCIVDDKRAGSRAWEKLPEDAVIRKEIETLAGEIRGKPQVLGVYLQDEPSAAAMPGIARVAKLVRENLPDTLAYVNLFPTYASEEQLRAKDYQSYVQTYLDTIHPQFISWDNYSLLNGAMLDRFFTNMEIIRTASLAAKVPFWNCILATATFNFMEPSDATLSLQVYSTLAYGGRGIQYFTYFTPPIGDYRLAAIDPFGNKTATWDVMRRINLQIQALAPVLLQLRSTGVYHGPAAPAGCLPLAQSKLVQSVGLRKDDDSPATGSYLLGEFEDGTGRPYVMIVNKDLSHPAQFELRLKTLGRKLIAISPYTGKEQPFGAEMDWLAPGAGALFRIE